MGIASLNPSYKIEPTHSCMRDIRSSAALRTINLGIPRHTNRHAMDRLV
jgi:hypothetical protein